MSLRGNMIRCWPVTTWHPAHRAAHHVGHAIRRARHTVGAIVAVATKTTLIVCAVVALPTAPLWAPPAAGWWISPPAGVPVWSGPETPVRVAEPATLGVLVAGMVGVFVVTRPRGRR